MIPIHMQHSRLFRVSVIGFLIAGMLLRFLWLDTFPPLLTQDEASIAYNAWSIVQTGRDEWGNSWPVIFEAFGDAKQPGIVYLTAAWLAVTGWHFTAVRLVSAVAGTLTLGLMGWLAWQYTRRRDLTVATIAIAALSPWLLHMSRLGLESNVALTLLVAALALQHWGSQARWSLWSRRSLFWMLATAFLYAATAYTYIAYRLVVPIWLIASTGLIWYEQSLQTKRTQRQPLLQRQLAIVAVTLVLIAPSFLLGSTTRLSQVGWLREEAIQAPLFELRNGCHQWSYAIGLSPLRYSCVVLWNTTTMPIILVGRSYLAHLSPQFWFLSGDDQIYRNPLQAGAFPFFLLPLFALGWYRTLRGDRMAQFASLGWLIALLPSTLTADPQAIRLTSAAPFVILLILAGLQEAESLVRKQWTTWVIPSTLVGVVLAAGIAAPAYLTNSFVHGHTWLSHGQRLSQVTASLVADGYTVFIDPRVIPEMHTFYAFWNQMPPSEYQQLELLSTTDALGFKRPTQLGSQIQLATPDYEGLICASDALEHKRVLIVPPQELRLFPVEERIQSVNGVHTLGEVIFLTDSEELQRARALFCQYYQPKSDILPNQPTP